MPEDKRTAYGLLAQSRKHQENEKGSAYFWVEDRIKPIHVHFFTNELRK